MLNLCGVVVFHRSMVYFRRGQEFIWCTGIPQIYGQLEEEALVYVHSAIYETDMVQWYSIDLQSIEGGWAIC